MVFKKTLAVRMLSVHYDVTDYYISRGFTVHLCALYVSKAIDKANYHGLFVKLMGRVIHNELLLLLENWFSIGVTCVKRGNVLSVYYKVSCGIRLGGVPSPYLFAVIMFFLYQKW